MDRFVYCVFDADPYDGGLLSVHFEYAEAVTQARWVDNNLSCDTEVKRIKVGDWRPEEPYANPHSSWVDVEH